MNPVVVAAIGVVVTVVAYNLASGIQHRIHRALAQLGSVLVPAVVMGIVSANPVAASEAGQYWVYGITGAYILGKLFGGSSKST